MCVCVPAVTNMQALAHVHVCWFYGRFMYCYFSACTDSLGLLQKLCLLLF